MKRILTLVILVLTPSIGWPEIYVYPKKVEHEIDCDLPPEIVLAIETSYSDTEAIPAHTGVAKAKPVDLNADGTCEVFLDTPSIYEGNGNPNTSILTFKKGEYVHITTLPGESPAWWYGTPRNGYLRIFVPANAGHRTNPVYVTDVYYFDGHRYITEFDSEFSHGRYMDLALDAYRDEKYGVAEKYYSNAFRMFGEKDLGDANNLAVTWIKQGRHEQILDLLLPLVASATDKRELAAAYFNMGKIAVSQEDLDRSLEYFERSNAYWPTRARQDKVTEIRDQIVKTEQSSNPSLE